MKKRLITILSLITLMSLWLFASATAANWSIDQAHSNVGFEVRHMVISKVRGYFNEFSGTINFDGKDFSKATVEVFIDPRSIDTRNENRDNHLRSPDFFAADSLPEMKFVSTKVTAGQGNNFQVTGNLTMRGVTKPVTLDCEFQGTVVDQRGNTRAAFSATGKLNRQDWGVSWSRALDTGGLVVSDEVTLLLDVQVVQAE